MKWLNDWKLMIVIFLAFVVLSLVAIKFEEKYFPTKLKTFNI